MVSGLVYGALPTGIAAAMIALYRLYMAAGRGYGRHGNIVSAGIGILWRAIRKNPEKMSNREFYFFGVVTHVVMMLSMLLLRKRISCPP
jgi:hypothetical protein